MAALDTSINELTLESLDIDSDDDTPELMPAAAPIASTGGAGKKVPLTLLTGYLGAGKSTVVNYILTENHGRRIAVILNEFGDSADIENRTVSVSDDADGGLYEEMLELDNGCLCCSIRDQGVAAISKLMAKKGRFDYILLETTGLADPSGLAEMFWENELFADDIYLDGVVTVVDAKYGLKQMDEARAEGEATDCVRQIACADSLLLNKTDLVTEEHLVAIESAIRTINATTPIHRASYGRLDLSNILSLDAYASAPFTKPTLPVYSPPSSSPALQQRHAHPHDCADPTHDHPPPATSHLLGISTLLIPLPTVTPAALDRLDAWVRTLLWENALLLPSGERVPPPAPLASGKPGREILRTKGLIGLGDGRTLVLQGVRDMYEMKEAAGDALEEGKLVFIGRGLEEDLRKSLMDYIA